VSGATQSSASAASPPPSEQTSSQASAAAQEGGTYTVASGDTVSTIAERFGMKSDELRSLNNLKGDSIRVGQTLKVRTSAPASSTTSNSQATENGTYTVASGDTVSTIAERFGMKSDELRTLNNLPNDNIRVGQKLKVSGATQSSASAASPPPSEQTSSQASAASQGSTPAAGGTYTVASGDTVSTIAERFGMKSAELRALNNLPNDNIRVGQKLKVSGGTQSSATPATSPPPSGQTSSQPGPTQVSGQVSAPSPDGTYTVASGDTVSTIAERFGMKSAELRALNNLPNDNIRVGQKLNVRAKPQASTPSQGAAPQAAGTSPPSPQEPGQIPLNSPPGQIPLSGPPPSRN
ncbi:MAG: LysM peptidoglycan-binding domain-containing protein, partial [Deltaproteobacteria bacterium]|nr:LysM peptidoglycan-binding domain-containing protein [Deltaproteobacteria bacterium]